MEAKGSGPDAAGVPAPLGGTDGQILALEPALLKTHVSTIRNPLAKAGSVV